MQGKIDHLSQWTPFHFEIERKKKAEKAAKKTAGPPTLQDRISPQKT